jgi:hypothetical protein
MQHDISDISFSLLKMTFNLNGSVNQYFNFIDKMLKTKLFVINSNKIHIFCFTTITRLKQDATRKSDIDWFFYEFMTTELLINKDVSKTDETLHDECIFKCRKWNIRFSCCIY